MDLIYSKSPEPDYLVAAMETVLKVNEAFSLNLLLSYKHLQIHMNEKEGDILLFLTGEKEIEDVCFKLKKILQKAERGILSLPIIGVFTLSTLIGILPLICLPLYAALPPSKQMLIFEEPPIIGKLRRMIFFRFSCVL